MFAVQLLNNDNSYIENIIRSSLKAVGSSLGLNEYYRGFFATMLRRGAEKWVQEGVLKRPFTVQNVMQFPDYSSKPVWSRLVLSCVIVNLKYSA